MRRSGNAAVFFIGVASLMLLKPNVSYAGYWQQDVRGSWYQEEDGTYPVSEWRWIDGDLNGIAECYYFDQTGYSSRNTVVDNYFLNDAGMWVDKNGTVIIVSTAEAEIKNASLKKAVSKTETPSTTTQSMGWIQENGVWKYRTNAGILTDTWKSIDNKKYYFWQDGTMATGHQSIDGGNYCFGSDGALRTTTFLEEGMYYVIEGGDGIIIDVVYEFDWSDYRKEAGISFKDVDMIPESGTFTDEETDFDEGEIYDKIIKMKKEYPERKKWTNANNYRHGSGCAAFAFIVQDTVFGNGNSTINDVLDWDELRVGDHIRLYGSAGEHSVIILEVEDDSIKVTEGNYNSSIHWGRIISQDSLEEKFIYQETRY